jgi:glycolate oxidase iron-sulfur subunit
MGELMANAVEKCVHCGFCLPACPTYQELWEEMDSPRGRIILMKSVLEGTVNLDEALPYVDRCLGCQACVTACPSGVPYGELILPFRAYAEKRRRRRPLGRAVSRRLAIESIPYPRRFRAAARAGQLARPVQGLLPGEMRAMLGLLPSTLPPAAPLPEVYPAQGQRRARVALLAGCVQQALGPEINWATLRVLARNGVEVVIPRDQTCCGGLAIHVGDSRQALALAEKNLAVFPKEVDAVITNAAGCGSGLKDYALLFKGSRLEADAQAFAARVKDVSEFLDLLGIEAPPPLDSPLELAYQDACHLAHAQKITAPPRRLLAAIGGLAIVPIQEAELCCGSAGMYSIQQPELAGALGERKVRYVLKTGARLVASGNIGCITQMKTYLAKLQPDGSSGSPPVQVFHTMEVLDRAYRNELK